MPPQMGSYGACDVLPAARTTRRTLLKSSSIVTTSTLKRTARSKATVAGAASTGVGRTERKQKATSKGGDMAEEAKMRSRVGELHTKYGEELRFLVSEFTELEALLAPAVEGLNSDVDDNGDGSGAQQQLGRLRYFIAHVQNTTDRIHQAKEGLHHYTSAQLDMLEEHIRERLLPVKERLLAQRTQLVQRPAADEDETEQTPAGISGIAGIREQTSSSDSDVSDSWKAAAETAGVDQPSSVDNTEMGQLARPCSTLSLAELGELCGDAEADDCGNSFLVDGDCDDSDGAGIGLDLMDLGLEDKRYPFLTSPRDGSRGAERSASMSTLSSVSAMTDGEFSDDTISVDASTKSCGEEYETNDIKNDGVTGFLSNKQSSTAIDEEMSELSDLFAPDAFLLSTVLDSEDEPANSTQMVALVTTAETSTSATCDDGNDQTDNPKPSAYSVATTTAANADDSCSQSPPACDAVTKSENDNIAVSSPILQSAAPGARERKLSSPFTADLPSMTSASSSDGGCGTVAAPAAIASAQTTSTCASVPPNVEGMSASKMAPAPPASSTTLKTATSPAVFSSDPAPSWSPPTTATQQNSNQTRITECPCGEASCPSSSDDATVIASRKRASEYSTLENNANSYTNSPPNTGASGAAGDSTSGVPLSMATGMSLLHIGAPRQRKRQRSLAPVLSAPRTVAYECSLCKESYQTEVSSNPWWSLFRQECPRCHRTQIPRVDATSAATSVDYIHAVCAEEGEVCDSDGNGSESCSDSEEDDDDDDYKEGIACFDTEVVAGDSSYADGASPEGRLSTAQASRLLVLMAHARTCPGRHANSQHAEVCRSIKFLMLHIRDCTGRSSTGEPCEHRWCLPCKSLLSHLVRCPQPETCRICTPLDLPGPLRQLRELNLAQARAVVDASSPESRCSATASSIVIKTESCYARAPSPSTMPQ